MSAVNGKIAAILSRTTVVINRGSDQDVSRGDTFWIYSELGPFIDPDTKENLGTTKKIWGKVVVSTVERRFCIAETEYEMKSLIDLRAITAMFGGIADQKVLPVDVSQISKDTTKIEVGFQAFLEKKPAVIIEKKIEALPAKKASALPPKPKDTEVSNTESGVKELDGEIGGEKE